MENNIASGLDIGTTKIAAMIGRKNAYGKLEILGIGKSKSLGVHRGVVNNITQTIQSIQQAVQEAEAASGMKIEEVTVGIAGQHIRSLQHSDYITRANSELVIDEEHLAGLNSGEILTQHVGLQSAYLRTILVPVRENLFRSLFDDPLTSPTAI